MRILQLIQKCQLRGAEVFACQLAEELNRENDHVDVAYLFDYSGSLPFNLKFIPVHANHQQRFWDFAAYKRLSDIIKNGRYDVVQANAGDTLKYAALSKLMFGWRAALVFRNANKMSDFFRNGLHLKVTRWFLSQCDYFISVSENCREDLIRILPGALIKSETITIGTKDYAEIVPIEITQERPTIVNIGSLVPEKNHFFLIEVFKAFSERHRGTLLIVGDGKLREPLEEKIRSLDLTRRITLLGVRKDAVNLLKTADLLLMPSKIEGLPGVILEALSCGVPVIASDVGGIPEIIKDRETGFIIHGWDIDMYLKKMEEALYNDSLRSTIMNNGRRLILSKFMMPEIAARFSLAYSRMAAKQDQ